MINIQLWVSIFFSFSFCLTLHQPWIDFWKGKYGKIRYDGVSSCDLQTVPVNSVSRGEEIPVTSGNRFRTITLKTFTSWLHYSCFPGVDLHGNRPCYARVYRGWFTKQIIGGSVSFRRGTPMIHRGFLAWILFFENLLKYMEKKMNIGLWIDEMWFQVELLGKEEFK